MISFLRRTAVREPKRTIARESRGEGMSALELTGRQSGDVKS
jgi:hypothetical protein